MTDTERPPVSWWDAFREGNIEDGYELTAHYKPTHRQSTLTWYPNPERFEVTRIDEHEVLIKRETTFSAAVVAEEEAWLRSSLTRTFFKGDSYGF